jgi:hypothetical protein
MAAAVARCTPHRGDAAAFPGLKVSAASRGQGERAGTRLSGSCRYSCVSRRVWMRPKWLGPDVLRPLAILAGTAVVLSTDACGGRDNPFWSVGDASDDAAPDGASGSSSGSGSSGAGSSSGSTSSSSSGSSSNGSSGAGASCAACTTTLDCQTGCPAPAAGSNWCCDRTSVPGLCFQQSAQYACPGQPAGSSSSGGSSGSSSGAPPGGGDDGGGNTMM